MPNFDGVYHQVAALQTTIINAVLKELGILWTTSYYEGVILVVMLYILPCMILRFKLFIIGCDGDNNESNEIWYDILGAENGCVYTNLQDGNFITIDHYYTVWYKGPPWVWE